MKPYITASMIDRYMACPGHIMLTQIRRPSKAAAVGTEKHKQLLNRLPDHVNQQLVGEPHIEIAMAADLMSDDSMMCGYNINRQYPDMPGPHWLAGTADVLSYNTDTLVVCDLKTGYTPLPHPAKAGQLLALAWLACRTFKLTPKTIRLMWWICRDDTDMIIPAEITMTDLDAWHQDLRSKISEVYLAPGAQCQYCDRFDVCPAMGRAINAPDLSNPDCIVSAYVQLQIQERMCEQLRQAIEMAVARCDRESVTASDGHTLSLVRSHITKIDPEIAARVLGDKYATCITTSISQTGIKRALGTKAGSKAIDEIAAHGGISQTPKDPYLVLK